jgi:hypothetical protein
MVNRIDQKTNSENNNPAGHETAAAINYFSENLTSRQLHNQETPRFDDLIVSLANTHENRRARQVVEWERMRRQNFPLSV